jgi:NAD(P)-dependent dehydrogenase (short-subunit alcohol dehydrogenase family)
MLMRAFLPGMIARGAGAIINISSGSGRVSEPDPQAPPDVASSVKVVAYGATKAALNRLTLGLAQEYASQGVAINALEVNAVVEIYRMNLPDVDYSQQELPEAPAQLVAWLAAQPPQFTGRLLVQRDLLPKLRAQGVVRPKVDPA